MTICILGRQPKLGLAELESVFGTKHITSLANGIAQLDIPAEEVASKELGGVIKVAKLLTQLPARQWREVIDYTIDTLPEHIEYLPAGKIKLGISEYGLGVPLKDIEKAGLTLKKTIKKLGRSVRLVPNKEHALNSAQVLHNKLTHPLGIELLYIRSGNSTVLAQTLRVQDIESYSYRDRTRPRRDAFVGMLPPKLAQIMVNLAKPSAGSTVLDPFCGTGVLLQEAALMGYKVYGTDIEPRMIAYSRENIFWLMDKFNIKTQFNLDVADATTFKWKTEFGSVATEVYLGQPLSGLPDPEKLQEIIHTCNSITRLFLKNLASQIPAGSRHCVAMPAWHTPQGFHHLPLLDSLQKLGFKRLEFTHATQQDLIYHRPDQIVARELVILEKQ